MRVGSKLTINPRSIPMLTKLSGFQRIATKGLLIVSLPLIVQVLIVSVMWVLQARAEQHVAAAVTSRRIVQECSAITRSAYTLSIDMMLLQMVEADALTDQFNKRKASLLLHAAKLKALLSGKPSQVERVNEFERVLSLLLSDIQRLGAAVQKKNANEALDLIPNLRRGVIVANREIDRIMGEVEAQEKVEHDTAIVPEQVAIVIQRQWLLVVLVINALLCLVLARFFTRSITSRIDVLITNSKRLAKNEPLIPVMGGEDELAQLDCTFHQMTEDLLEARMEKQRFISMITHDLRSPLTSFGIFFEQIEIGGFGAVSDVLRERVPKLRSAVQRSTGLINELLDRDKLESGQLVSSERYDVDLGVVLNESITVLQFLAQEKEIDVVYELPEIIVRADESRMIQVFQNLIANAIKFSPRGGTITIAAETRGDLVSVTVRDQGPGIAPADQERVFQRYEQVHDKGGVHLAGSGVGLWVCREIIRLHGGTIAIESTVGNGTVFIVQLPTAASQHTSTDS